MQTEDLPDPAAIEALLRAEHGDPFALLGPHPGVHGWVLRAFLPDAEQVAVIEKESGCEITRMHRVHPAGLYSAGIAGPLAYRLRIETMGAVAEIEDPYAFPPALGELDVHLLAEGRHHDLGTCLGAQIVELSGVPGVRFAVWAPNARRVSVVGDFNHWDGRRHPMRLRHAAGVWEIFLPRLPAGSLYKYEILGPEGHVLPLKADPVAWRAEPPPATASIIFDRSILPPQSRKHQLAQQADQPIAIFEVHAASWLPDAPAQGECTWRMLQERLVPYVVGMGFTHVEFMPVMEHPFGGSWGYQPLGQFAPSARLGPPEEFAALVDAFHRAGIGVILDWVPAHFPTDAHGLARFDGTALYEHADPREGFHRDWNTLIYNLGRNEVRNFLLGSALHWLEHYRVDGLRVDAVASMLYRDYSRAPGEWVPNRYGGRENLEAIDFLRELSEVIAQRCPGAVLIAEESTAWPNVSAPAATGGLGFSYKWNMGWMHDTLRYMQQDPVHRRWHHAEITFGLVYAFAEHFVLPLSHDEVVYGKGSLIGKMPGDDWQRFANLRAYFGFMWAHPGKKLLFMGGEFAQEREWNHDRGLDWNLLDHQRHRGVQLLLRDLNRLYRAQPALYRRDAEADGFRWLVLDDSERSVFAFMRLGGDADPPVLAVCNFTPLPRRDYRIAVGGGWREVLNTDAAIYGGSNLGNAGFAAATDGALQLLLPPLATLILVREWA